MHGPSWITVTARTRPAASFTSVMPSFFPISPLNILVRSTRALLEFDLHVYAGGQVELAERVDGLLSRLDHVEQPFVRADFKMLARLFVDVRRAVDGEPLDPGRQRNRA